MEVGLGLKYDCLFVKGARILKKHRNYKNSNFVPNSNSNERGIRT